MATLTHFFKSDLNERTTTSTTAVEQTNYTISWSNLTGAGFAASDDVFILVQVKQGHSSANGNPLFQVGFGTTYAGRSDITDSLQRWEPVVVASDTKCNHYTWFDRRTLVTNENIYFSNWTAASGTTTHVEFKCWIIKLGDLGSSNFFYADNTPAGDAPTSYGTEGASASVPATGDWLVFACTHWLSDSTSADILADIYDGTTARSEIQIEGEDTSDEACLGSIAYLASLGSGTTMRARFRTDTSSSHDCNRSAIFGIRLNAFQDHYGAFTTNSNSTGAFPGTIQATTSFTLTTTGPIIGFNGCIGTTTSQGQEFGNVIYISNAEWVAQGWNWEQMKTNGAAMKLNPNCVSYEASRSSGTATFNFYAFSGDSITCATQTAALFSLTLAVTTRTLTATAGTVVVAGASATLKYQQLPLTATAGTVVVNGAAATLKVGHKTVATAGTVVVNGDTATLKVGHKIVAAAGTVVVNGDTATLKVGHKIVADAGIVVVNGDTATLKVGYKIVAAAGTVVVNGDTATLKYQRLPLTADVGIVVVNGASANLKYQRLPFTATEGVVVVNGAAATLTYAPSSGIVLTADPGTVVVAGTVAALKHQRPLTADAGTVIVNGGTATLKVGHKVVADVGAVVVNGSTAYIKYQRLPITAGAGTVVVNGGTATLEHQRLLAADAGTVIINGVDAALKYQRLAFTASAGTVVINGADATLARLLSLTATQGTIVVAGATADIVYVRKIVAFPGVVVINGADANLFRTSPLSIVLTSSPGSVRIFGDEATLIHVRKAVIAETLLNKRARGVIRAKMGRLATTRVR